MYRESERVPEGSAKRSSLTLRPELDMAARRRRSFRFPMDWNFRAFVASHTKRDRKNPSLGFALI